MKIVMNKIILDRFGIIPAYIKLVKYYDPDPIVAEILSAPTLQSDLGGQFVSEYEMGTKPEN